MASPLSYALANVMKRVVVITMAFIYAQRPVTPLHLCGVAMSVFGTLVYRQYLVIVGLWFLIKMPFEITHSILVIFVWSFTHDLICVFAYQSRQINRLLKAFEPQINVLSACCLTTMHGNDIFTRLKHIGAFAGDIMHLVFGYMTSFLEDKLSI